MTTHNQTDVPTVSEMDRRLRHLEDVDDIRTEIAFTRAHLTNTIQAIQDKLSPERLKQEAQDVLHEATIGKVEDMAYKAKQEATNWRRSTVRQVKDNPIPAALIGAGLAWMFFSGSDDDEYDRHDRYEPDAYGNMGTRYGSSYDDFEGQNQVRRVANRVQRNVSDAVSNIQQSAAETAGTVQSQVNNMAESAQEYTQETGAQLQQRAAETQEEAQRRMEEMRYEAYLRSRQAKRKAKNVWSENPLAVGAAAVAAGVLFGYLLPSTETEDRWMGDTRQQVVDQVQDAAYNTYEKAQNVASEAVKTAERDLTAEAKTIAKDVKETATSEAEKQNITEPTKKPVNTA